MLQYTTGMGVSGKIGASLRAWQRVQIALARSESLRFIGLLMADLMKFAAFILAAAGDELLLQHLRGSSVLFTWIGHVANWILAFIGVVFLVEAAALAVMDVAKRLRKAWRDLHSELELPTGGSEHKAITDTENRSTKDDETSEHAEA